MNENYEYTRDLFFTAATGFRNLVAEIDRLSFDNLALGSWSVITLIAHSYRAITTVVTYCEKFENTTLPVSKRASEYFSAINLKESPSVIRSIDERAVQEGNLIREDPLRYIDTAIREATALLNSTKGSDIICVVNNLTISLNEYLKTRIFELTVHGLDLQKALAMSFSPQPEALEMCLDLLLELNKAPDKVIDLIFILTGREASLGNLSIF